MSLDIGWIVNLTAECVMKHKRVSNKQMRQMMSDLGIGDDHQDEEQLLLERRDQAVSEDKQLINLDSENK
ncbi:hypothetical protein C5F64_17995 [Photobacterium damselae subsp. damselae]|uniref:Uncharacterized protein n=1 Tax=Photobacterium damselae TaxID=38293 RepID=A0ABD6X1R5_PHODM|nr:hypothetical protein [Photobacterium damselae]MCG3844545.1 hypothetical protein [Photobacterium damselae]PSB80741.1 hypothetical protein C5F64_17995 [Photobacterium damselae subsp. damselae]PSU16130.1 hypothetical protein CTM90_14000 [Photobacterium damselae]